MDSSWKVDIRNLYPSVYINETKTGNFGKNVEEQGGSFAGIYDIQGTQISVSIESFDSGNSEVTVEKTSDIFYDGKEIFYANLLENFKFKGNIFFVDKTIIDPYVPPIPSSGLSTPQVDQDLYPMFQIQDFQSEKLNDFGVAFHSFSKGTVAKTSVVIHTDSLLKGNMGYYQIFLDKKQLTNNVKIDSNTIDSAYDMIVYNGQKFVVLAFLTLDGKLKIDTAKSSLSSGTEKVSSYTSNEEIYGKKVVIKGNRQLPGEAVISVLDHKNTVSIYRYSLKHQTLNLV